MRYPIILEWSGNNFGVYSPDVPGCFAAGDTMEEAKREFQAALAFHFEGLREEGLPIPEPSTAVDYVEVDPLPQSAKAS
ncbi:MAG: type II toxin-antitoxin system HicB family antitoxin [Chloroflexi bacterium]|nr:type II toxin-antitoxin system HicB family antitoxin [Chloroflexota bacterium]